MNPLLKALLSQLGGVLAIGVDTALQSAAHPTGGLAAALGSNQGYAMVYAGAISLTHIFVDNLETKLGLHPAQQ